MEVNFAAVQTQTGAKTQASSSNNGSKNNSFADILQLFEQSTGGLPESAAGKENGSDLKNLLTMLELMFQKGSTADNNQGNLLIDSEELKKTLGNIEVKNNDIDLHIAQDFKKLMQQLSGELRQLLDKLNVQGQEDVSLKDLLQLLDSQELQQMFENVENTGQISLHELKDFIRRQNTRGRDEISFQELRQLFKEKQNPGINKESQKVSIQELQQLVQNQDKDNITFKELRQLLGFKQNQAMIQESQKVTIQNLHQALENNSKIQQNSSKISIQELQQAFQNQQELRQDNKKILKLLHEASQRLNQKSDLPSTLVQQRSQNSEQLTVKQVIRLLENTANQAKEQGGQQAVQQKNSQLISIYNNPSKENMENNTGKQNYSNQQRAATNNSGMVQAYAGGNNADMQQGGRHFGRGSFASPSYTGNSTSSFEGQLNNFNSAETKDSALQQNMNFKGTETINLQRGGANSGPARSLQMAAQLAPVIQRAVSNQQGTTTLSIKLKPEGLGELTVHLRYNQGNLQAHFIASTPHAREMLDQSMAQLKENLSQMNINLNDATTSSGDNGRNWEQQSDFEQKKNDILNGNPDLPGGGEDIDDLAGKEAPAGNNLVNHLV